MKATVLLFCLVAACTFAEEKVSKDLATSASVYEYGFGRPYGYPLRENLGFASYGYGYPNHYSYSYSYPHRGYGNFDYYGNFLRPGSALGSGYRALNSFGGYDGFGYGGPFNGLYGSVY